MPYKKAIEHFNSVTFFGCPHPNSDTSAASDCALPSTPDTSTAADAIGVVGGRHFAVDDTNNVIYLCDSDVVGENRGEVGTRCYAAKGDEGTWNG